MNDLYACECIYMYINVCVCLWMCLQVWVAWGWVCDSQLWLFVVGSSQTRARWSLLLLHQVPLSLLHTLSLSFSLFLCVGVCVCLGIFWNAFCLDIVKCFVLKVSWCDCYCLSRWMVCCVLVPCGVVVLQLFVYGARHCSVGSNAGLAASGQAQVVVSGD